MESCECGSTYQEICRIPVGESFRKDEVVDRVPGGKVRDSRRVVFSGERGDLIVHDNVVPRRLGADFLEETFFGGFGECFLKRFVGVPLSSNSGTVVVEVGWEFSAFVEETVFDGVVATLRESRAFAGSLLDVAVLSGEVEEPSIFDVLFLAEDDECMMMRTVEVFLAFLFVTLRIFVVFAGDDDVCGIG